MIINTNRIASILSVCSTLILAAWLLSLAPWRGTKTAGAAAVFATITVNTNVDAVTINGLCSLREALLSANGTPANTDCTQGQPGLDTIVFNLSIAPPTISVTSALPTITEPVFIDGATGGATRIELNGTSAGSSTVGLRIAAGNSTIRNLVINRFGGSGIRLETNGGNTVQGCYIGTNAAGTADQGNGGQGIEVETSNNLIGGTTIAARNVISGNNSVGVSINNAAGTNNQVQGNYIGVNAAGTGALGNSLAGIVIGSNTNTIGGTAAGAGNVISGNGNDGIVIGNGTGNVIQGNLIGTNAAGTAAIPNSFQGISLNSTSSNTTVGGTAVGARNVISGNGSSGIRISTANHQVLGNYIGTNADGTAALGNAGNGIEINGGSNNTIGGSTTSARNIISGNQGVGGGVFITGAAATGNVVRGNYIGTDVAGNADLGNSARGIGVFNNADSTQVLGNLISGNNSHGVDIAFDSDNCLVQANFIGTNAAGTGALGNGGSGVLTSNNSNDHIIGGTSGSEANIIAFNGANGVRINPSGRRNRIQGNSIFSNTGLGIDLDGNGITANDLGDGDTGPNNLQNFPIFTSAITVGGNTTIQGTLNSTQNGTFRIEFFSSPACDAAGNGEGRVFLGFSNVNTNTSGNATINTTLAVAVTPGEVITATAMDFMGNTSEFSPCSAVTTCPTITVSPTNPTLPAGQAGQAYSQPFTQTGGNGAITWSLSAGALPNGLALNGTTGLLSGTPTVFGTFSFTIRATDAIGCTGERAYTLTINNVCATIAPANQTFMAAGGSGTVTVTGPGGCNWTAVSNEPWITVTGGSNGAGNGTVSYTVAETASASPRTGKITIANRTFYVNQIVPGQVLAEDFENGIPSTWTVVDGGIGGEANFTWAAVNLAAACPLPLPAPFAGMVALANGSPSCVGRGAIQDEQLITPSFNATGLGRVLVQFLHQFKLDLGPTHTGDVDVSLDGGTSWINVLHQTTVDGVPTPTLKTLDITNVIAPNPANVRLRFHYSGAISSFNRPTGGGEVIWPVDACRVVYSAISPTSQNFAANGGAGNVSVTVAAGEPWTAQSNDTWITGVTPSGTGSGTANYTVAPNTAAIPRTGTLTIAGNTFIVNQAAGSGLQFFPLPQPVRLLETRAQFSGCTNPGAPINANGTLTLPARTVCAGIPANAAAVTGNVTVVPSGPGFLTLFPSTATQPVVANSNFAAGEVTNNVFTVGLGAGDGAFKIFASATTEVIVDVTGYYAPPGTGGLYFHPLPTPVRLLETRTLAGLPGCLKPGAPLTGGQDFSVQGRAPIAAPCNAIPAAAQVLVGNATSVFPAGAGFLTIFPSDTARPLIASSNYAGGDIINGPFAVKLGAAGQFKVYTHQTTELVIDILGYYSEEATDANGAGLLFSPLPSPVRLLETRPDSPGLPLSGCTRPNAPITGNLNMATHTQMAANFCGLPAAAQAVVGNASVVNTAGAGFLTLFPANLGTAPLVATSNYPTPATFGYNRHYIVGLSPGDGKFKVLTQFTTDLVLDASGYFAP